MKLNLGCGRNILPDYTNVDSVWSPGVDVVADLNLPRSLYVIEDDSVDEMLLSHVIEHINKPLIMMEELYRVAKPYANIIIRCPHGASDDAAEDPTHVRFMYPGSFGYFSQPYYWRADYGYRGDWEIESTHLWLAKSLASVPPAMQEMAVREMRNQVREMVCIMRAIKPARPPKREFQVYRAPIIHIAEF